MAFKKYVLIFASLFILNLFCGRALAEKFELCPGFSYCNIPENLKKYMTGKSYIDNKYVKFDNLRLCKILYIGFDNKVHEGEIVVAYKIITPGGEIINIAEEVLEIFKELYDLKYPIEKVSLIDDYDADDEKSMQDNNSSAFVFRYIRGTEKISWHSHGLAIDINPRINPCYHLKTKEIEPCDSDKYLDRTLNEKGLIKEGDACFNAFVKRGWDWGGFWDDKKDYMHFQKFPRDAEKPEFIEEVIISK